MKKKACYKNLLLKIESHNTNGNDNIKGNNKMYTRIDKIMFTDLIKFYYSLIIFSFFIHHSLFLSVLISFKFFIHFP